MITEKAELFYYVGIPLLGLIIWFIKLEGKTSENTKTIREIHLQLKEHLERDDEVHAKIADTLTEIREDVGEIKGLVRNRRT